MIIIITGVTCLFRDFVFVCVIVESVDGNMTLMVNTDVRKLHQTFGQRSYEVECPFPFPPFPSFPLPSTPKSS